MDIRTCLDRGRVSLLLTFRCQTTWIQTEKDGWSKQVGDLLRPYFALYSQNLSPRYASFICQVDYINPIELCNKLNQVPFLFILFRYTTFCLTRGDFVFLTNSELSFVLFWHVYAFSLFCQRCLSKLSCPSCSWSVDNGSPPHGTCPSSPTTPTSMIWSKVDIGFFDNVAISVLFTNASLCHLRFYLHRIMNNKHMFDATEIFRTLGQHKKECFIKLGFYLLSFFYYLYR